MFEVGQIVKFRGREPDVRLRVLAVDAPGEHPVIAMRLDNGGVYLRRANGDYSSCAIVSAWDLVPVPVRVEQYLNVYPGFGHYSATHKSLNDANDHARGAQKPRVGILRLVFEGDDLVEHEFMQVGK